MAATGTSVIASPPSRSVASMIAGGNTLAYDRLIVSPGVEFQYGGIPGLNNADAQERVLHAWKAGVQTLALRKQLEAMRDGGVYALHIPKAPYRCPPGPYERICQVADYFKRAKPKSKIIVLDSNEDLVSKKGLFLAAWNGQYKGMIEYKPNSELLDVDVKTLTAKLQFEDVKADVLNVVPPQKAGLIAEKAGLTPSMLSQIESGRLTPSLPTLGKLAGALGVPIGALFEPRKEFKHIAHRPTRLFCTSFFAQQ